VPVTWPEGGPWALATTSATVDWQPVVAALAAASTVRVAALVFGAGAQPGELLLGELATCLRVGDGAADPLSVDEAAALVRTLARTHGLVLAVGVPGLLVPLGGAGWTLMDLAVAVSAPVVVVTGTGPDAANHTTLALAAAAGHGLAATVVTVGGPATPPTAASTPAHAAAVVDAAPVDEAPAPATDAFEAGIPVTPAGRIPAELPGRPAEFAGAARGWLDPVLHASAGRPKADTPPPPRQPLPPPATAGGKRVVLVLAGVFVSMSLVVCGLAFCQPTATLHTEASLEAVATDPGPRIAKRDSFIAPAPQPRPVDDVCPQNQGRIIPAEPDRATVKRVNAAWKRIEVWLAAKAPATRRSLRPPATETAIDAAQRRMSVAFPADLVASLRRHDGVAYSGAAFTLPFFYEPMPVKRIPDTWRSLCTSLAQVFDAAESTWWDKAFVPFASSGDGGNLFVDLRPGGHGRVGEFFNETGVSFSRWPGSVAELLEKTADSLETGRPFDHTYQPRVTKEDALVWDIN